MGFTRLQLRVATWNPLLPLLGQRRSSEYLVDPIYRPLGGPSTYRDGYTTSLK